jgi:hypothetical protein
MSPFTRIWELAPAIIDYVASRLGVDRNQACTVLKDALQDGRIRGHGLIVGVGEIELDRSFWRFAAINPDGSAVNLSSMKKLAWFEINVEDVLRIWPAAAPEPVMTKSTRQAADWNAIRQALEEEIETVGFPNEDAEPGWRNLADLEKWVTSKCGPNPPAESTIRENAKKMLAKIAGRKAVRP